MKKFLFVSSVLLLLSLAGCFVTRAEGDQMLADINRVKSEIAALQRERNDQRQLMENRLQEVQSRTSTLEKTSFKQSADTGLEKERLVTELQQLRGQLEETQHRLGEIQQTPPKGTDSASNAIALDVPASKPDHFAYAKKFYDDEQYESAVAAFDSFVDRYKDDKQFLNEAYFLRGDAYFQRAKSAKNDVLRKDLYKKAVLSYQEVLTRSPSSSRAPESLYNVGLSLEAMGYPKDAIVFYQEVSKKHPKSSFAKDAKKRLTKLSPPPKKKKKS